MRFHMEMLAKARARVGDDFLLGIRITGDDLLEGGNSMEDCLEILKRFASSGYLDFLNVVGGSVFTHAALAVNVRGTFLMTRSVQKYMVNARWGRIVSLSSVSAVGNRGQVNYSAAKAGMQGLTKTLAIELGKFGITANAVAPGFIMTDMTEATAARLGISFEDFQAGAAKTIPVGRVGQVEDVAAAISFLVSEGAGFVSGQILYIAGGPVS